MSYSDEIMRALTIALKNTDGLKYALKEFNENAKILERLTLAIEKQNELKERELRLLEEENGLTLMKRNYCLFILHVLLLRWEGVYEK